MLGKCKKTISKVINLFLNRIFIGFLSLLYFSIGMWGISNEKDYATSHFGFYYDLFGIPIFLLITVQFVKDRLNKNKLADNEITEFNKDPKRPIIVFLRPFKSSQKLRCEQSYFQFAWNITRLKLTNNDIELRIRDALSKKYLPIRFDTTDSLNGSFKTRLNNLDRIGSFKVGEHGWEEIVNEIALNADYCFIAPPLEADSGTAKEIQSLIQSQQNYSKLVFIMPQQHNRFKSQSGKKVTAQKIWKNLESLTNSCFKLPAYNKYGGIVIFTNREPILYQGFSGHHWSAVTSLRKLFISKEIYQTAIIDTFKIFLKIVFIPIKLLLVFVVFVIFTEIFFSFYRLDPSELIQNTKVLLSIILLFFTVLYYFVSFYSDLRKFMLKNASQIVVFFCSVVVTVVSFLLFAFSDDRSFISFVREFAILGSLNGNDLHSVSISIWLFKLWIQASILAFLTTYIALKFSRDNKLSWQQEVWMKAKQAN